MKTFAILVLHELLSGSKLSLRDRTADESGLTICHRRKDNLDSFVLRFIDAVSWEESERRELVKRDVWEFAEVLSSGCWSTQLLALVIGCYRSCMVLQQPAHLTALVCLVFQQTAGAERLLSQWSLWTSHCNCIPTIAFWRTFRGGCWHSELGLCLAFARRWNRFCASDWHYRWQAGCCNGYIILQCTYGAFTFLLMVYSTIGTSYSFPRAAFVCFAFCRPFSIPWIRCFVVDILGSPTLDQALAWLWPLLASAIYWYSLWRLLANTRGFPLINSILGLLQFSTILFPIWLMKRTETKHGWYRFLTQAHSLIL